MGGFDAGAFLELRQVVVGPLRTKLVVAKEGPSELFCTEVGVSCSGQKESVLLGERRKHEDSSSSWKMRLSRKFDGPELGIYKWLFHKFP